MNVILILSRMCRRAHPTLPPAVQPGKPRRKCAVPLCAGIQRLAAAIVITGLSSVALAQVEIAGVKVPGQAEVAGKALPLNGAGLRSRFFVKVYVGALYLGTRTVDAARATQARGPKRIAMHVVYDEIDQDKVRGAFEDGFVNNTPEAERAALRGAMNDFIGLFPALKQGDVAFIDLIPGDGIHISINGKTRGTVPGDDLQAAVMRIWLGDEPADSDLKAGMLGQ